jgi:hypothetical protein
MTPEGKIKAAVNKVLASYGREIYKFMPVPSGYGASSLDYILCVGGMFVSIETKKPGGKVTPRQHATARDIRDAGGKVFVIDSEAALSELIEFLNWVLEKPRRDEEVQAWPGYPMGST